MHDPTEPDRQEILEGPNNPRRARERRAGPETGKKNAILIAAALVAIFAASGVGVFLAGSQGKTPPAAGSGAVQSPGEPSGQVQVDPVTGDVSSDPSSGDADADAPGDGAPQDVVADDPADEPAVKSGQKTDKGEVGNDTKTEKPAAPDDKPTPTKQPQSADTDMPMDGPPGSIPGSCAASGC
jgi:hypothetical protein